MDYMLNNIIQYYSKVTDLALSNLKQEKQFAFKAELNNDTFMKIQEDHLIRVYKEAGGDLLSSSAKKLIINYRNDIMNMQKLAVKDYNTTLTKLRNTKDPMQKQKILNEIAERGFHGFTGKNGQWNIETYSNMYFTNVNNTLVRYGVLDGSKDDSDFEVSKNLTACEKCKPWEGKRLTREEALKMVGENTSELFHARCKHFLIEIRKG
jgi:hypothetical protein